MAEYQTSAESSTWTYFDWESLTTALRLLGNKQQALRGILIPRFALSPTVSGHVRCQALCQRWQSFAPECSGPLEAQVTLSNASSESIEELTAALKLSPSLRWARFHRGQHVRQDAEFRPPGHFRL